MSISRAAYYYKPKENGEDPELAVLFAILYLYPGRY
jgi:hypothetical protein